jgi:hypothetical protein
MALVGCNYGVRTLVFFILGVKFHKKVENINFTPKREYSVTIISLFSGKNVKFWKKKN